MKAATSLYEVIVHQESILHWCRSNDCRAGYFAMLYRRMTQRVQEAIVAKQFDDGARMEILIVNFANLYLQAWNGYTEKKTIGKAWTQVFMNAEKNNLVVLQHLILGINTHINLDLAKAAVQTCPGDAIYGLQHDFEKINDIIEALAQQIQRSLENIWWPLKLLTDIANNRQDAVLNFSISNARKASWANAVALSLISGPAHDHHLGEMEKMVTCIAEKVINPGLITAALLKRVVWMEPKEVHKIIDLLKQ
jgi:hypothetical protein